MLFCLFIFLVILPAFVFNIWLINQGSGFTIPRELLFRTQASLWRPILIFPFIFLGLSFLVKKLKHKFISLDKSLVRKIVFGICLILAFSLFFTVQTNPDMGRYHLEAKYLVENGVVSFFKNWHTFHTPFDFPVIPFLFGISYFIFGEGQLAVLVVNFLVYLGVLLFTYLSAKKLFNRKVGLLSIVLLTFVPYLPTQTPLMLVDLGETFFIVLSFYLLLKLNDNFKWLLSVITGIVLFLTALTKVFSPFYLVPLFITSFLLLKDKSLKRVGKFLISWIIGLGLTLSYLWWKKNVFLNLVFEYTSWEFILKRLVPIIILSILVLVIGFLKRELISRLYSKHKNKLSALIFLVLAYLFFFGGRTRFYLRTPFIAMGIPMALLVYYSVFKGLKKIKTTALLPWIFAPLFIPNTMFKYQLPAYPAMAMLAGWGLSKFSEKVSLKFLITQISFAVTILFFFFLPMINKHTKNNLRAVGRYVNNLNPEEVVVLFHPVGEQGKVWQTYIEEKATKPTPSFIHILDFYSSGEFEYEKEKEFFNEVERRNLPSVLVLGTHFYHQFPIEGELKEIIKNNYEQGPTFNKYRSGAGIWRVKLTVYHKK
jgi:4-amino-4-deoxy-L-arabinose transferase-like glycosyltransferase